MARSVAPATVEQEIASERVGALARTMDALERALAALAAHDRSPGAGPGATARRRELLEEAAERLWFAVVQREALGLSRHEVVHDLFRVPVEVRRAMGPRPRRAGRRRG